jgi:hypothetical protein
LASGRLMACYEYMIGLLYKEKLQRLSQIQRSERF